MKRLRRTLFTALAGVMLSLGAGSAWADLIQYVLTTTNGAPFTGPFVEVTVNRTSSTSATITFDSLHNGGFIYLMGGQGAAGVNVSGAFSLGAISGSNSLTGFTPGPFSNGGSGTEDGFGTFNQTINDFDGWTHAADHITFGITATGSNTWLSAGSVLAPNGSNQLAAVHLFACTPSGTGCSSTSPGASGSTYYAAGASVVPIPAAAWLFGSGLVGLIAIARRRIRGSDSAALA